MRMVLVLSVLALVAAASPLAAQSRDGRDRVVWLTNGSDMNVRFLYVWCSSCSPWLEDVLGPNQLAPGQRVKLDMDDGMKHCRYEIEAVFADERRQRLSNFDACETRELRLAPDPPA